MHVEINYLKSSTLNKEFHDTKNEQESERENNKRMSSGQEIGRREKNERESNSEYASALLPLLLF